MPRKTRKQKVRSSARQKVTLISKTPDKTEDVVVKTSPVQAKKPPLTYKETAYDKQLRQFTIRDTIRTLIITAVLFGAQFALFKYAPSIQGLF